MITDPQAVTAANQIIRPLADQNARLYFMAKSALLQWQAKGLSSLFPNDPTAIVEDGSATDGRHPISGADVQAFMTAVQNLVTSAETADANGQSDVSIFAAIAVNP